MFRFAAVGMLAVAAAPAAALAQDQQVGARTKAMGGSYTAFEDDPVSVWLNPAGIATQPDALSVAYQTYTAWDIDFDSSLFAGADPEVEPSQAWNEPALIPSYLGLVLQAGDPETPHAFGVCFTSPFRLEFPVSLTTDDDVPGADFKQVYYRFRLAYARDFRFRPPGTAGFLNHVALALALDVGVSRMEFTEFGPDVAPIALELDRSDTGVGGGAGILVGLYDDAETFKVNLGAAYQSKIAYDFSVSDTFAPTYDWPNQVQAGATFYLLRGQPLRVTFDAQLIDWSGATGESSVPGAPDYEDAVNLSAGVEYRLRLPGLSERLTFYPRAGVRRFDAPWDSDARQEQPAIRNRRIVIDPDDDVYLMVTAGLGVGWATEDGRLRSFDVAMDFGADVPGIAFGFTMEF